MIALVETNRCADCEKDCKTCTIELKRVPGLCCTAHQPYGRPRKCPLCNKTFKPMTDNQWKVVKYEPDLMSLRPGRPCRWRGVEVSKMS